MRNRPRSTTQGTLTVVTDRPGTPSAGTGWRSGVRMSATAGTGTCASRRSGPPPRTVDGRVPTRRNDQSVTQVTWSGPPARGRLGQHQCHEWRSHNRGVGQHRRVRTQHAPEVCHARMVLTLITHRSPLYDRRWALRADGVDGRRGPRWAVTTHQSGGPLTSRVLRAARGPAAYRCRHPGWVGARAPAATAACGPRADRTRRPARP